MTLDVPGIISNLFFSGIMVSSMCIPKWLLGGDC